MTVEKEKKKAGVHAHTHTQNINTAVCSYTRLMDSPNFVFLLPPTPTDELRSKFKVKDLT